MSAVDTAIARLQSIALASSDLTIRHAPSYPIEDPGVFPVSIAHIVEGTAELSNATMVKLLPTVAVDFHFNRADIKKAYTDIDACVAEFSRRLGGDPTLDGSVDTIVSPVSYGVSPQQWGGVNTLMLRFTVPIKTLEAPLTTAT